jgi:ATP-dependent protease HslVU (ClpYQ) peptidase subunit
MARQLFYFGKVVRTVVAGDGQVSLGNTVLKSKAKKLEK